MPPRPASDGDTPGSFDIAHFRDRLSEWGPERFGLVYPDPVLLVPQPPPEADEDGYETKVKDSGEIRRMLAQRLLAVARGSVSSEDLVFFVRKRVGGAFENQIGVGRARNADIALPLPRISKYHAYFLLQDGGLSFADAGSTNGSKVDGVALTPRVPVMLGDEATIELGPYSVRYLAAHGFREFLARPP